MRRRRRSSRRWPPEGAGPGPAAGEGGIWPFHNWSPDGHVAAPAAVSMFHAGVLMKLGAFAALRVGIMLLPEGAKYWSWLIMLFAAVAVVYGAYIAYVQMDLKYMIGFSSVSHMGLVMLGFSTLNQNGLTGAGVQMFSHGVMTALFFAITGMIYDRSHTRQIPELGGMSKIMPFATVGFIIGGLVSMGMPLFSGFIAEFPIFMGVWRVQWLVDVFASLSIVRWYRCQPHPFSPPKSDGEAMEELLDIYKRALKRHLISDVPVGWLLSGGVDSGLLLGLMSLYGKAWPTYTVGYGSAEYRDDELADAAETARIFSAPNMPVQLSRKAFEESLPRIVSVLEEPIAASSIVPMYFVCQRARKDVKVALVGQGPDELFGGYTRHLGIQYGEYWRRLPGWLRYP